MSRKLTRRDLLKGAGLAAGAFALAAARRALGPLPEAVAQEPDYYSHIPVVSRGWTVPPRVVHVHAPAATSWSFDSSWYGNAVDQTVVNAMVEAGLQHLTDTGSVAAAWHVLLPDYQPGQKVAVKVNLNNAACDDADNAIDALIEPVNALIRTLVLAGVQEEDVWVYDAIRPMPARFYSRRLYTQAIFWDNAGCADRRATFNRQDESLVVHFTHPALSDRWLTDLLFQASYLINMPILKRHGTAPVTLGFKNHFGSLNNLGYAGEDNPHLYINPSDSHYRADYSPFVDIYANANVAGKTALTIGDGLFGAPWVGSSPIPWGTFGGQVPNSLLFSRDPVAMDSVMCDLLHAEWGLPDAAYDYLQVAQGRGLGRYERGEPWGSGYAAIDYLRLEV